ncbi:unnamed protein product [Prorocentrum cordatum]|uniref:Ion transport domain-containing protein n=1 Tax=Prorocentrum cordatum TaxID=2364126 RepID=A0ABN9SSH8_9DINO|nr:unnamed protein product [Polarella glacialis]
MLIVPLAVFCFPENRLTFAMDLLTLVYWTLNVPHTLTMGYEAGLVTVRSPWLILLKYMRTWFIVDMVVLVPDWVIVLLSVGVRFERATSCDSAVEGAGIVRLLRNLRIVRLLRLARIARLRKLWQILNEWISSQSVNIVANITGMLMLLLTLSHFISCMWYAISNQMEGDDRWLIHYNMNEKKWNYLYATCLHWSLTQFTPAPMDIQPQNFLERVFAISVVVCALVGFSYVVGSITGSLAQFRSLKEEKTQLFWDLRVYLKRNAVEPTLSMRIQRYLHHAWRYQARNKTFSQIKILTMLSEQLQNELLFQLHSHLTIYPLVRKLLELSKLTAFRLARTAISTKQFANTDPLFIHGEKPSHMYLLVQGRFQYKRLTSEGKVVREMVDKGEDWIAEPAMWSTEWYNLGDCTAADQSSLTLVSPSHFCQEARRNPSAWDLASRYCRNFVWWLNAAEADELSDITQGDDPDKQAQLRGFMVYDPAPAWQLGKKRSNHAPNPEGC